MLIKRPSNCLSSEITPAELFARRRDFIKTGVGFALGTALSDVWAADKLQSRASLLSSNEKQTPYKDVTGYNNFYEFGTGKEDPKPNANKGWKTDPWTVELAGLVRNPLKIDANDLVEKLGGIEQRVYRFRCVEAWSMVIPWDGFQLSKLIALADPKPEAKFLKMTTFLDPKSAPGQRAGNLDYPYVEGLRLDEAMNELSFIATGIYGKPIPNQNGAPLRLVVPWKYGFKCVKSIVKFEFTAKEPLNTWQVLQSREYGFYANVNPTVDHPRWSQATERRIGETGRRPTLMFNGYEEEVASRYEGMDLARSY